MIGELDNASRQLYGALGRYMQVCGAIEKSFATGLVNKEHSRDVLPRVAGEVDNVLGCFTKMLELSKSSLARTRNTSAFTPVNGLPAEILGFIFRLVVAGESCFEECEHEAAYSKYPEQLAHVCSRWRRIAINVPDLWVHIDLSPHHFYNKKFLPRANIYFHRSGRLPLYIHLHGSEGLEYDSLQDLRSVRFIASVAARIKAIDINMNLKYASIFFSALRECFIRCDPGIFSRVIIRRGFAADEQFGLLVSEEEEREWTVRSCNTSINVPKQHLAGVLLGCTSLSLDGLFFPWASSAYQGLVELRLTLPEYHEQQYHIHPFQLSAILKSNPQLRILDFRLQFYSGRTSGGILPTPVALTELESLGTGGVDMATFLRLIDLRWKPLEVTFRFPWKIDVLRGDSKGYIPNFFSQSNVSRLWVSGMDNMAGILRLLQLAPDVRELVLESDCCRKMDDEKLQDSDRGLSLDVLYLFGSVGFRDMLDLLRVVNVHTLICWNFVLMLSDDQTGDIFKDKSIAQWFLELCPEVRILDATQCPCPIPRRS